MDFKKAQGGFRKPSRSPKRKDLIKGIHALEEALKANLTLQKVLVQKDLKSDAVKEITRTLRERDVFVQFVPKEKLNSLSSMGHQGIIAISSPVEFVDISQLIPMLYEQQKTPNIAVLDSITDVRNFGAIARSAQFMGVHAIVIPSKGGAEINEEAIKTSAGALLKLHVCKVKSLPDCVQFLKESGLQIFAATEKAETDISSVDLNLPLAIVLGSEDIGISPTLLRMSDYHIKIPGNGLDSLNVSVAAGICFYEINRKREEK